ncbi:ubiquinol-cytochrome c reductase iron-sulfur subunit [Halorarum halophilum]|uniref:Ubiquinol-cytochrome c reductase iron-sulfur subunit n=1 Tax=Halorarum halophilum TaxID=2743090 RepID=A0A7D5K823_9EURY|nr:ubiquinol-cytochrome c reductase iron-sulfur subunit [Halobaculum halophilum]QLG27834.1 ubiquinol-cytochrome c reductase iron-sulfur subunit [Halobaculum halophilum]
MSADDKYPGDSGRRRFVKGVVGGASLAGLGAVGSATVNSLTASSGSGGGATEAMAIENVAGPAPRGMPQIPIEIDDQGAILGVWPEVETVTEQGIEVKIAETQIGGRTYSTEWFQYCGVETYQGVQPAYEPEGGNYFHAGDQPGYEWQTEAMSGGDQFTVDMFSDYQEWGNGIGAAGMGKPATGTWRSQDTEDVIPIQLMRSPVIEQLANSGSADAPNGETYEVDSSTQEWLSGSTSQGFIAWLNKCTHFCCVPGFKSNPGSARYGAADGVYCPCHQSVYVPYSITPTLFTARPRPDDSGSGE